MKPTGTPIATAPSIKFMNEVTGLNFDLETLNIFVRAEADTVIKVEFSTVIGFRVLDERDLLDFWPTFSSPAGWAFEVFTGGWHDLESTRVGYYIVSDFWQGAREFLITGCNHCVSVIALRAPTFDIQKLVIE